MMGKLLKVEYFKLPKSKIVSAIIIAVVIIEILAIGLFLYNIKLGNVTPTANRFLIYAFSWFTPVFFILYGTFTSLIVSNEYEHKMWSMMLVSQQSKRNIVSAKYITLFLLTLMIMLVFMLVHAIVSLIIIGTIPQISVYLYILFAVWIGTLAMQAIQYTLSLMIENKVYIIGLSIFFAIVTLIVRSEALPFKIPEHIISSEKILHTNEVIMFNASFIVYAIYTILVFIVVSAYAYYYMDRKDF